MRLEWGPVGAAAVTAGCDVAVVVDVLSFTTCLSVAADRGVEVWPWARVDDHARELARSRDAVLAVRRAEAGPGQVSLSPATIRAAPVLRRLVLPSPNGSTISATLAERGVPVVGASLRNRVAVARWLRALGGDPVVAVVAAGERRSDGSLRPAVEDLWGAGAVISGLVAGGDVTLTPEARSAAAAFDDVEGDLPAALHACASGRELDDLGFPHYVDVAAEIDLGTAVPVLRAGAFAAN